MQRYTQSNFQSIANSSQPFMGPGIFGRSAMFAAVLFLMATIGCSDAKEQVPMETNMVFYMQDWATGPNVTAIPVAGVKNSTVNDFGTIMVIDDAVTEGIKRDSKQVGRAQGIYVNSALDGRDFHLAFSIVFTNEKYNGSTLEIQGADRWTLKQREVSVVSGTGVFRFARGYAVLETSFFAGFDAVIKFNVTLRGY